MSGGDAVLIAATIGVAAAGGLLFVEIGRWGLPRPGTLAVRIVEMWSMACFAIWRGVSAAG